MAGFKFKLQRILDIRATQERMKQNELAVERKKEWNILQKISNLEKAQSDEYLRGRSILSEPVADIRIFVAHQRYFEELEMELVRAAVDLDRQRDAVEAARQALIEAARKRKLLEKLKDKRYHAFKKEEETAEQKTIDEVGGAVREAARRGSLDR